MKPERTARQLSGNVNTSENAFIEYEGKYFVEANGLVEPRMETRKVPKFKGSDETMVIVDLSGVDPKTGERLYITLWPRDNATEADLKSLPQFFEDITFRLGFYEEKDENGVVVKTVVSEQPKWTVAKKVDEDGVIENFALQGGKRDFDEEAKKREAFKKKNQ